MKVKKTEKELLQESIENSRKLIDSIRMQLANISIRKNEIYQLLVDCKNKKLVTKEKEIRARLAKYMATEKRYENMIMDIQLSIDDKISNNIDNQFISTINNLALDSLKTKKSSSLNIKKVKNNILKAKYKTSLEQEKANQILEVDEYMNIDNIDETLNEEYDQEIDEMLKNDPRLSSDVKINL